MNAQIFFFIWADKRLGKTIAREENYGNTALNTFPESKHGMFTKEYQAEAFAEEHIADIIKENEKLKTRVGISFVYVSLLSVHIDDREKNP